MPIKKVVIPVAGLGTRFLPATKAIPKEMITLVDQPLIQYVVQEAVNAGFTDIILVTHSSKQAIENHFDHHFELETTLVN
ncbi:MAG: sugar phosphate nucleotidyltransferase, partial [Thiomicrorhabdus sp.]|nr:sugar phosphate nucleotidyltransferase [Thiomicrorhabdus sp.]